MAVLVYLITDTSGTVISVCGLSQTMDQGHYAGCTQVAVDPSDPRVQAFLNPPPSRLQLAAQAFAAGCVVVSVSTPSLSGTYGILPQDEINLSGLQSAINAGQPWLGYLRDVSGAKHTMTAAQFTPIAEAILQYIAGIDAYAHGESAALPPQPSPIL